MGNKERFDPPAFKVWPPRVQLAFSGRLVVGCFSSHPTNVPFPVADGNLISSHLVDLSHRSTGRLGDRKEGPDGGEAAETCEDKADVASEIGLIGVDHLGGRRKTL